MKLQANKKPKKAINSVVDLNVEVDHNNLIQSLLIADKRF